jgi:hypothetical protein
MSFQFYKQFTVSCTCGQVTSRKYAREHGGKCKACVTGVPKAEPKERDISNHPLLCPTCKTNLLSPYQKAHHYHCDSCTREADPMGYYNEVMGRNDPSGDY